MSPVPGETREKGGNSGGGREAPVLARAVLNRSAALPCIAYLAAGSRQQTEIIVAASGVFAPRTIVDSLRILEDEGLVVKMRLGSKKGPIEYRLSDHGERILAVRIKELSFGRLHDPAHVSERTEEMEGERTSHLGGKRAKEVDL
jgi:DNA-binding HxlR family transcriptional regulator